MYLDIAITALRRSLPFVVAAPLSAAHAQPQTEPILVTGTRIVTAESAGVESSVTVTARRIEDRAITNVADALNEVPGHRGSITPTGDNPAFGQGVNFISLYGLGSQRTLVLVNGRRAVSSNVPSILGNPPGSQVDLNAIPAILVERVDRIAIGGAPVYGSDAIAGTVNVILKRRMQGAETRTTRGVTAQGDGFRWNWSAAGGMDFAGGRGNITGAIGFERVEGLVGRDRSFFRANLGNATNPCTVPQPGQCSAMNLVSALGPAGRTPQNDGRINPSIGFNDSLSDGNPGTVLIRDLRLPAVSRGGVISGGAGAYGWQFASDGSLVPYDRGIVYGAPVPGPLAAAAMASGGDGLALTDYLPISSDLERLNAALSFSYDLGERMSFFADGLFYRGKANELVQLPSFNAPLFGGVSGPLTFRTDNPFLTEQARNQFAALGYGSTFQLSRAHADLADLSGRSESNVYRLVAGLRGQVTVGGSDLHYEASANYGRSDFTDFGQTIDQQRFVNAVNVAAAGGRVVCSVMPTVSGFPVGQAPIADPACVPLNLFGEGAPSPEALDYILRDTVSRSRLQQFVAHANIGGSPFAVFGNPASFNLGYEHREERAAFQPDAFLEAGLGRSVAIAPTTGRYDLDEVFGEVLLPLITSANNSVVSRLTAFGRIRHVDNSANGGFTAWSAGGAFAPIDDVELRGNFTRSFRAPAIAELYSPRANVNSVVPDLCSPANIGVGPVPEVRRANCTAFLARYPNATPLIAATATVPAISGGNPGLRNERADSFTYGAVLRPRFLPGLTASVDYLNIRINDPIANLTVAQIAQGCFDNPDFDAANPANGNRFCAMIPRDATGQVVSDPRNPALSFGYVNGKRIEMSAVQAGIAFAKDGLEVGGDLFHLRRRLVDVTGVAPTRSDGIVGDPRWQGQLRFRYAAAAWGVAAQVNYTGSRAVAFTNRGDSPSDTREFDHFDGFATVDATLFFLAAGNFRLTLTATNLFNRVGQTYHGYIIRPRSTISSAGASP